MSKDFYAGAYSILSKGYSMLRFFARIFFPFAFGYYLSYLYRTVNAVIAPDIIRELELSASTLGWVSSAYFVTFALFQVPLGILLDRFEIRKIAAIILLFAAIGALLFSQANTAGALWFGRAMIGLGVSASLMAAFKAYVIWLPAEKLPMINGLQLAAGGIGAVTATAPVEFILLFTDWRGLFIGIGIVTFLCAALLYLLIPRNKVQSSGQPIASQLKEYGQIFRNPIFYSIAPASVMSQASFIALQSLWIGQWLRDVERMSRNDTALYLLVAAVAMVAGFLSIGAMAVRLQQKGITPATLSLIGMVLFLLVQLAIVFQLPITNILIWSAFGFMGTSGSLIYASLSQQFPKHLTGRVNTSLNLLLFIAIFLLQWGMGLIIEYWQPNDTGHYPLQAYQSAFGISIVFQIAALLWYRHHRSRLTLMDIRLK